VRGNFYRWVVIITENFRNLPKSNENLPKTNHNPINHDPDTNPNLKPKTPNLEPYKNTFRLTLTLTDNL